MHLQHVYLQITASSPFLIITGVMRSKVATLAFAMAAAFASFAGADEGSAVAVERPLRDVLGNTFEFPRCSNVTVSGISSGGFFAVQFHVAFSALVQGAGVIAGGPYFASQGNVQTGNVVLAFKACVRSLSGLRPSAFPFLPCLALFPLLRCAAAARSVGQRSR